MATRPGINRDPASPPLFRHIRCRAAAARRVQHQVPGVSGHEDATLNHLYGCLHDVELLVYVPRAICVIPYICDGLYREIIKESHKPDTIFRSPRCGWPTPVASSPLDLFSSESYQEA